MPSMYATHMTCFKQGTAYFCSYLLTYKRRTYGYSAQPNLEAEKVNINIQYIYLEESWKGKSPLTIVLTIITCFHFRYLCRQRVNLPWTSFVVIILRRVAVLQNGSHIWVMLIIYMCPSKLLIYSIKTVRPSLTVTVLWILKQFLVVVH